MMTAPFEDIEEPENIAVDVSMRIDKGVPHPCLCGKIDHPFKTACAEKLFHCVPIGNVCFYKCEPLAGNQHCKACLFKRNIVIVIHVIEAGNPITALKQLPADMKSYKSGCAGHQNMHQEKSLKCCKYIIYGPYNTPYVLFE